MNIKRRNFLQNAGIVTAGALLMPHIACQSPVKDTANEAKIVEPLKPCLLYTSPSPRDATLSRMPSSA